MLFKVEIVNLIDVFFGFRDSSATAATIAVAGPPPDRRRRTAAAAAGVRRLCRLAAVLFAGNFRDFSLSKVSTIIVFYNYVNLKCDVYFCEF